MIESQNQAPPPNIVQLEKSSDLPKSVTELSLFATNPSLLHHAQMFLNTSYPQLLRTVKVIV